MPRTKFKCSSLIEVIYTREFFEEGYHVRKLAVGHAIDETRDSNGMIGLKQIRHRRIVQNNTIVEWSS